jgi:putative transposase
VVQQTRLIGIARSTVYAAKATTSEKELTLLGLIDEEYTRHPFYGNRRLALSLRKLGYVVNRKRMRRLMKKLGLLALAPAPNTSKKHPEHKIYPYLLRGVVIIRPNQVWSTDITYVRLVAGFAYLTAILDWYSRHVLSWRISNSLESTFCLECLEEALFKFGVPELMNTDQGVQYTSLNWINRLLEQDVKISMDGRGRALDNIFIERLWRTVKHEDIYLRDYGRIPQLQAGLTQYFEFYNTQRPHQSLSNLTPAEVYYSGIGGGAKIVDRFGKEISSIEDKGAATDSL